MNNRLRNNILYIASSIGLIIVLVFLSYGYTLQLPLFWDDLWHYKHVVAVTKYTITNWRPLVFSLYRLVMVIQGKIDPSGQHAIPFILHICNSCLIFTLVNLLSLPNKKAVALCAATFFILYPFSAEAVTWVAALTHPLVTNLALSAIVLFITSRRAKRRAIFFRLASIACAFLAPFANEAGVVVVALIGLVLQLERAPRRAWLSLIPYAICSAIGYYALHRILPNDNRIAAFSWQALAIKVPYLMQALAYPLAPLVTWVYRLGIPLDPNLFGLVVYSVILLVYLWVMHRFGQLRIALFAIGWFIIACSPLFLLNPSHILVGPRLLYISSPGVVLLWALPLTVILASHKTALYKAGTTCVLVGAVLLASIPDLAATHDSTWQIKTSTDNLKATMAGRESPVLIINYPNAIGLHTPTFLYGRYSPSITASKSPNDLGDLLYWNGMPGYQITNYYVQGSTLPPWHLRADSSIYTIKYDELVSSFRQYRSVFTTELRDTLALRELGGLEEVAAKPEPSFAAQFDSQMTLLGSTIANSGAEYTLTLRWQCLRPFEHQAQIFVHVYDKDGNLVVGQDQQPLLGMSDVLTWQAGDVWRDVRYITLPENTAPGDYTVALGMYTLPDVVRLPAYTSSGQRLEGDVVYLGTIKVP